MMFKKGEFSLLMIVNAAIVIFFPMGSSSLEAYHESGQNYGREQFYYHESGQDYGRAHSYYRSGRPYGYQSGHTSNFRRHWRNHFRNGNGWNHNNHSYWSYDGNSYGNNNSYYDQPTYYYYVQPDNGSNYYYESQPDQILGPQQNESYIPEEEQGALQEDVNNDLENGEEGTTVGEKDPAPLPGRLSLFIKLIAYGHLNTAFDFVKGLK